jgi:hypothetical protein
MVQRTLAAIGVGGMLFLCSSAPVSSDPGFGFQGDDATPDTLTRQLDFLAAHPGTRFAESPVVGRIERVYGRAFSHGVTGEASAEAFRVEHAAMFGAEPEDIVPVGALPDGRHVQGLGYDPAADAYKFTGYFYTQQRDGVPVYGSGLCLLVRNEQDHPLVLASANLRDLGDLQVAPAAAQADAGGRQTALAHAQAMSEFDGAAQVISRRRVIWAGVGDTSVRARLADEFIVAVGSDKWRVITDAAQGHLLYDEHLIIFVDIDGTCEGNASIGPAADFCAPEEPVGMPYIRVGAGINFVYADVNGNFTIPNGGAAPLDVTATLDGQYFDVIDFPDNPIIETENVTPPGPAYLLFNEANTDEQVRAQVNGYKYPNVTRDFILAHNPTYPVIAGQTNFPVYTNRDDFYCPGNAWYDQIEQSINFCLSGSGYPNTAWTGVIMHEYGHHLVEMGGSGQGAYGEGMGDTLAMLILDDPCGGNGFYGVCDECLRTADNDCQYSASGCSSCGSEIHDCGQLLSGCVWSTRNNLVVTEPSDYMTILATIAIDAVLMRSPGDSSITDTITVDYLTLDDDDADILNGTPHYAEINGGFSAHGLPGPELQLIGFEFPSGHPDLVSPSGGDVIAVNVVSITQDPQPGTGMFYVDTGSGFTGVAMTETGPNQYEAEFPPADCGAIVEYYFTAEASGGGMQTSPPGAPAAAYTVLSAAGINEAFHDDFESNQGWTTENIGATSGLWERGVPVNDPGWDYDPMTDGDGSGQAFLTQNQVGNTDVDDGAVRLTSPVFDMTGADNYSVAYEYFLRLTNSDGTDRLLVEMSSNGDAGPWLTVAVHDQDGGLSWHHVELTTAQLEAAGVTFTANMKIRFTANDGDPQSINEAGVDGFTVYAIECDTVIGDMDGNGIVDVADFLLLLSAWGPCQDCPPSCPGDFDGDCAVGVNDFLMMLANWTAP